MPVSAEPVDPADVTGQDLTLKGPVPGGRLKKALCFLIVQVVQRVRVLRHKFPHDAPLCLQDGPRDIPLPLPDLHQGILVHPLRFHQDIFGGTQVLAGIPPVGISAESRAGICQLPEQALGVCDKECVSDSRG